MARRRVGPSQRPSEETRERVLRAFSDAATRAGIRSVVMSELASKLRMSATTLYNCFPSKDHLVMALVERWANDFSSSGAATIELASDHEPVEQMIGWAEAWAASVARFAPPFWEDLRRDHTAAWQIFRREIARWKQAGAAELRPRLRADIHPEVALAVLDVILTQVSDPRFSERAGCTRRQTIETAVRIWARGALERPGTLMALAAKRPTRSSSGKKG